MSHIISTKEMIAGTVIVPMEELLKEGDELAKQAYTKVISTAKAKPSQETEQTSAMCIKAAAPILKQDGSLLGILYGGNLLK